jgi:hypothetical protein
MTYKGVEVYYITDIGTKLRCGQLHAPAALFPGEEPSEPIG